MLTIFGFLVTTLLGVAAWNGRRLVAKVDEVATKVEEVATKATKLETVLIGSDEKNGIRGEVRMIRQRLHDRDDQTHTRLAEWSEWRGEIEAAVKQNTSPAIRRRRRKADNT